MTTTLHTHTPTLATTDARGLTVGSLAYYRSDELQQSELRLTRHSYDPAGRLIASQDPRLPTPNQRNHYSLSGQVLLTDSVDAGWRLSLLGEAGQALTGWDGRGTERQSEYDELLRPVAITEQDQVVERFTYGGPETADDNQCNQLARHDDTAGTLYRPDYGLLGSPLTEVRHFLRELDMPDWPLAVAERAALLEANGLESSWAFNALGEVIEQTDAMGNTRQFKQTVAGQLKSVALGEQVLLSDIRYNAFDQVEQETAGNGVISRSTYDPQSGRLIELRAGLADAAPLQLLKYGYDPVGNILEIEDAAQPVSFFANQRIEPVSRYRYDTLYQLIEASGREVKTDASHGPALPDLQSLPPDPNQIANYTQNYDYDAGGNLLEMRHLGAQPFTRIMQVAANSNRSLPDDVDVDFKNGFDANGNLQQLVRGQDLSWDLRNQLRHITTVQRDNGPSDHESYIYDGGGQRCRKVSSAQAQNRTLINEVRYLPGLEIRTSADGEILHVISADAGRNSVRLLHWQARMPDGIDNDQLRYSLSDHLGSSTLELDQQGGLISQESYYPFGGTSWWAARSAVEAKYKTARYSGKERDISGLYYYGFRYYAAWLQRWINPDPAGDVDGLNLYAMVRNNPIRFHDTDGRKLKDSDDYSEDSPSARAEGYSVNLQLTRRLRDQDPQAAARLKAVANELSHQINDRNIIKSTYTSPDIPSRFSFENEFLPGRWRFLDNFRDPKSNFYASDVTWQQYAAVSKKNNFYGVLPKLIVRWDVINKNALSATDKLESGSKEMLDSFLNSEGNGRSTQRILDEFSLHATKVEKKVVSDRDTGIGINVIAIHVEPLPQLSDNYQRLKLEVERDIRRMSRPPLSRAMHSAARFMNRVVRSISRRFQPQIAR